MIDFKFFRFDKSSLSAYALMSSPMTIPDQALANQIEKPLYRGERMICRRRVWPDGMSIHFQGI